MKIRRKKLALFLIGAVLILNIGISCMAETVTGDLSNRFQDGVVLEHEGVNYRLKKRATFSLIICVNNLVQDQFDGYFGILAVDDNAKSLSLIELDERVASDVDGVVQRLSDAYLSGADKQEGSLNALFLINQIFPYEAVNHYIVFEMEGLAVLNDYPGFDTSEYENLEGTKQKLKYAKHYVENLPSDQWSALFEHVSKYLKSDMKSGAIMKIADKAEKYERMPTFRFIEAVENDVNQDDVNTAKYIYLSEQEINEVVLNAFVEPDPYSNN
ncbi:MAG: hypothetical protein IKJ65_05915 [Clostridia bacterium]|nr:hypothetical protein [Clostridia bacterium]